MATTKIKGKCLQLSDKVKILEEIDRDIGVTELSKKYGVAKSTICKIKKNRHLILNVCNTSGDSSKKKTLKTANCPKMEKSLYQWFSDQKEKQIPVSGLSLREKAKTLHAQYNESNHFNASEGWLQRFKTRYNINIKSGEKTSKPVLGDPFKDKLAKKINELQLDFNQIYNANETGIYWKYLPEKTHVSSVDKTAPGKKTEKQRLTFLMCTNATGMHKVKPLVIGNARHPRNLDFDCPIDYDCSKSAWMTSDIFKKWFHLMFVPQVKTYLRSQNLPIKALLLLESAPSHPPEEDLKTEDGSISIMYMPPNVIPLIQPIDQNIVGLAKLFYQKYLLLSILSKNYQNVADALKNVTLRDAILNLKLAWDSIQPSIIEKCWHNILSHKEGTGEDYLPLRMFKMPWKQDAVTFYNSVASEVHEMTTELNPIGQYAPEELNLWNESGHIVEEKEYQVENGGQSGEITRKYAISDAQAIKVFNEAVDWAECNGASYSDILVLKNLRSKAVEKHFQ